MKITYFILLAFLLVISCRKIPYDGFISGTLLYTDTLSGYTSKEPVSGQNIKIRLHGDSSYLYKTTTDDKGQFKFDMTFGHYDKNTLFDVFFDEKIGIYPYYGKAENLQEGSKNIIITAYPDQRKQNGFIAYLKDTPGLENIPKGTIRLYNSLYLAKLDDPNAAIDSLVTDDYGKIMWLNLPKGMYYITAYKKLSNSTLITSAPKSIEIPEQGLETTTVFLH